jgi:protein TonB
MKQTKVHHPSLDDLAFEGRNKEYGAYYLRKNYRKRLTQSGIAATLLLLLLVSFPILHDLIENPAVVNDMMPVMEFYDLGQPPDDDLYALAKTAEVPPPVVEKVPVVVDSVKVEEQKVEEVKPKPEQEPERLDSAKGTGGEGNQQGIGPGDDTGIYTTIDVYPRFPGGDQARFAFLRSQVRYPEAAIKAGVQGVVVVVFVIEKDGSVSNVDVSKPIGGGCDEEAIRVVKLMPRWDPGKRSGKAVRVLVKMPIVFRIPGKIPK